MITTGFFDLFKPKKEKKIEGLHNAPTMSGGAPFYTSFGKNIYASDIIVQAIQRKANEFKKLDPRHIRTTDGAQTVITDSSIARVLKRPNAYMTQAEFLEKITFLLELTKNVFIYPTWYKTKGGEKYYTGLYPLKPSDVSYLTDASDVLYIKLRFASGYEITLPADEVIHWRKDYGLNDYFGGSMFGGNDDAGLLTMLERYDQLTQSIAKAIEVSCNINAIVNYNSYNDDDNLAQKRVQFEKDLKTNGGGILFTDLKMQVEKFPRDVKLVDAETIKFFHETILRSKATSLPILNANYTKSEKEAWYETALEGDIKNLGQAMSRVIFNSREASFGNEIVLYPNEIQFMSMENKIQFAQIAMPAGALIKDEFRALFGYPPLPDGQGQVIAQGYNNLLDENNNNKLGGEKNE